LGNCEQQRCFPAAGLAHYGQELSTVEVHVNPVYGNDRPRLGGIRNRELAYLQQPLGRGQAGPRVGSDCPNGRPPGDVG
jgi:hypothetical protein